MKNKIVSVILSISIILCAVFGVIKVSVNTVYADMGPKPSVVITFTGLGDEVCYATLLSETKSTGPANVWSGKISDARYNSSDEEYPIWQKLVEYKDSDGYYFLQNLWRCDETDLLDWNYYPPERFKILLYFPESDSYAVSGIYERYAFDSYYHVDVQDNNIIEVNSEDTQNIQPLIADKNYDYTWQIISLASRFVITVIIELGIALFFGFRDKKTVVVMLLVNLVTQLMLNIMLNYYNLIEGYTTFLRNYIFLEIIVLVVEALIYSLLLPKIADKPKKRITYVEYAVWANVLSFVAGFIIAKVVPGIF